MGVGSISVSHPSHRVAESFSASRIQCNIMSNTLGYHIILFLLINVVSIVLTIQDAVQHEVVYIKAKSSSPPVHI